MSEHLSIGTRDKQTSSFRAGGNSFPLQVSLHHRTEYSYPEPIQLLPHIIRLRPAPHCRTPILNYSLRITPGDHFLNWQQDPYSNYLARLVFNKPTRVFCVEVDLVAAMTVINPFDFFIEESAESFPFEYEPLLATELIPYREKKESTPLFLEMLNTLRLGQGTKKRTIDFIVDVNRHVSQAIKYIIRMEPGVQPCEETLQKGCGSCRDSAWLLVQLLRHLGLAARFVSGYLIQLVPDIKPLDGPPGPGEDFTDLHAWTEVFLPGAGWVGLDPTSGLLAGEGHIPLACVADPIQGAPITGGFRYVDPIIAEASRKAESFHFQMEVKRFQESPRVTKPYSDAEWQAIDRLGNHVDHLLETNDVRLTMGGEPTFVSIDDREGAEWNFDALGEKKRVLAGELLLKLRNRFAPGGVLHYGQGKLYPGESLPRWSFSCHWRKDGIPVWQHPELLSKPGENHGHGPTEAGMFARHLAGHLAIHPGLVHTAYEDVWYQLWQERKLPTNASVNPPVDPLKADLKAGGERQRLGSLLDRGLATPAGFVLPLEEKQERNGWRSSHWPLRREHLYLIPGDSPMGYRLPLDSLLEEPPHKQNPVIEADPFERHPPLPQMRLTPSRQTSGRTTPQTMMVPHNDPESPLVRTALCVEARQGCVHVFLPPLRRGEAWLELMEAIEETALALKMPVFLEGYQPPFDARLMEFQVTPDPGVIEVNIHPSASWPELVERTATIYAEAFATRLSTEKFQMDGRHTGTCGGNHIILGGRTVADSPVLRRPDLLRSMVSYWHNHPSLSYLFSGLFVGPTSQAPRVDEARNDSLFELEIAFRELDRHTKHPHLPWLADRLFRNLLTDLTGNTHRAEFCIDKLYSPDSTSGRRGLLEMRGFEMPPHARMSLVQHLLLRALVANFWSIPYRHSLVRWGTDLHDRWMLPHFIWKDFVEVLGELANQDIRFDSNWFLPHFEFRFPLLGSTTIQGIHIELRQAIEPWHVLGEQPAGGATSRYVDSSLERLEVKVSGMTDSRYQLICNGFAVPLRPTGQLGEWVAGVRYRAWQPPECLHPTIKVHAPLVFDLIDHWQGQSVGGCTYHVSHPGGRSYAVLPVNALEAEARRAERFQGMGHSPGPVTVKQLPPEPESSLTLDLRRT